ncbi:acyl-CoA dehydrogenase family protein [Aquihabitans sp. McL0605]|uniref:acyl-CoA dehydrogenase family protein n=1 Tax=Aquihabitans sp. McL0605 TaxID=3415671 RepID=UPI003CE9FE5D
MDFVFDDDQLALQTAVADVLAKECTSAYLRSVMEGAEDPAGLWSTLVGLDWPALAIAEHDGGVGMSFLDLAIVLEQLGYVADPTPFLATTTQFAPLVTACGSPEQRQRFLGAIAADGRPGTAVLASAVTAQRTDAGWELHGTARFVVDGHRATEIAVVAESAEGPVALVVPADAVEATRLPSFDKALPVSDVCFDGAVVGTDRHLAAGATAAGAAAALDQAVTGLALVSVGACQRALDLVIEYVSGREQFGVPIGSFQAVKHKVVDMYVAIERARALAFFAALTITEDDPRRTLAASMAKAAAGDAQRLVFQGAIQLYGGIGFTWENDVHLYVRRAKGTELLFGGAAEHRARVGRLLLDDPRRSTEVLTGAADV